MNGSVAEVSTKRKCDRSKWNAAAGRAEGKTEFAKSINAYLEVIQRKIYELRKQLVESDEPVTAENIKTLLQEREIQKNKYMLMEVFKHHNDQMAALVNQEYAPCTLDRYETSYRHTQSFLRWNTN